MAAQKHRHRLSEVFCNQSSESGVARSNYGRQCCVRLPSYSRYWSRLTCKNFFRGKARFCRSANCLAPNINHLFLPHLRCRLKWLSLVCFRRVLLYNDLRNKLKRVMLQPPGWQHTKHVMQKQSAGCFSRNANNVSSSKLSRRKWSLRWTHQLIRRFDSWHILSLR